MVQLLLGYDADLEAEHEGLRPQALAAQREHTETAAVLQKAADRRAQRKASSGNASVRRDPEAAVEPEVGLEAGYEAAAAAAAAAAAVAAQKKRLKRERQKSKAAASAEAQAVQEAAAAEFGAAESKAAAAAAAAAAEEAEEMHVSSPPPSLVERRADALLAERALAEMSVEVAKKERFAAAVEGVAVAKEKSAAKDAVSERLQHLSMGAAKKDQGDRLTAAVEEVAAQKGQAGTTGRER